MELNEILIHFDCALSNMLFILEFKFFVVITFLLEVELCSNLEFRDLMAWVSGVLMDREETEFLIVIVGSSSELVVCKASFSKS